MIWNSWFGGKSEEKQRREGPKALGELLQEKSYLPTHATLYFKGRSFLWVKMTIGMLKIYLLRSNELGHTNSDTILLISRVAEFIVLMVYINLFMVES